MAALVLAWVIDRPVQAISLISVTYILVVTRSIQALPDVYAALGQSGIHIRQSPHAHVTTITRIFIYVCTMQAV